MNVDHIIEVALLILVAYLVGCTIGYVGRRFAHAHSQDRYMPAILPETALPMPVTFAPAPLSKPATSSARRLARAAADDETLEKAPPRAGANASDAGSRASLDQPAERQKPADCGDDLKKIKGIGAKSESALHALGVYNFDQIAAWTPSNIAWLENRIAIKGRIIREQWVQQAALLAAENKAAKSR